jgi:hypothetical protein
MHVLRKACVVYDLQCSSACFFSVVHDFEGIHEVISGPRESMSCMEQPNQAITATMGCGTAS